MYVVALVTLATPGDTDAEAAALAADLGATVYEQRLQLAGGLPAVVLTTPDADRARALLRALRGRGHGAAAFDAAAVVPSGAMLALRRGRLEADALVAEDPARPPGAAGAPAEALDRLPFEDVLALIRASQRRRVEETVQVKERKFGMGRAVMTGGLMLTKKVTREETRVSDERMEVLYLFRRSGARPWLLRERGAAYTWLGDKVAPASMHNFQATVALLRERAPGARYDDRLTGPRRALPFAGEGDDESPDPTADLLAHVLALWAARGER